MARSEQHEGATTLRGMKTRFAAPSLAALVIGLAVAGMAQSPAYAADDQQLQMLEDQIRQLQAQIDSLKKTQVADEQKTLTGPSLGSNKQAYGYETPSHQFGWVSADGRNSIELTGRLHFDVGSYLSVSPNNAYYPGDAALGAQGAKNLDSGVNARRARIGVTGRFDQDFSYALIYDFGGSSDSFGSGLSGGSSGNSSSTPFSSNGGIENAYVSYNGFNNANQSIPFVIDAGYQDIPWTLDEAMSSNDIMFMERSSAQVIATTYWGGNDFRSAADIRSFNQNYFAGLWLTGPQTGANHTFGTAASEQGIEQSAVLARATYNPIIDNSVNETLHVGVDAGRILSFPSGYGIAPGDRPELRIDPTKIVGSASTIPATGGNVIGAELAGSYDHFFAMGEYWFMDLDQTSNILLPAGATATTVKKGGPDPTLNFNGGYLQASYALGGERHYNASSGSYTGVIPDKDFTLASGGGAWEFAIRGSYVDMNSNFSPVAASTGGILAGHLATGGFNGGKQVGVNVGVNYYFSPNLRIMLDYVHEDIYDLYNQGIKTQPIGTTIDAIAGRFQVAW